MRRAASWIVIALALGWLVLFLSSSGVLVFSHQHRPAGAGQDVLSCSYFSGVSIIEKQFWYSENGILGREACPRIHRF